MFDARTMSFNNNDCEICVTELSGTWEEGALDQQPGPAPKEVAKGKQQHMPGEEVAGRRVKGV